jgi:hypothetical protein
MTLGEMTGTVALAKTILNEKKEKEPDREAEPQE